MDSLNVGWVCSFIILFMGILVSCMSGKEILVGYDYNYKGNFKKYQTFDMMQPTLESDSSLSSETIRRAIISRMEFLGYKRDSTHPNLIVTSKLFLDSLCLPTYAQPEFEQWLKSPDNYLTSDSRRYFLRLTPGTLLIQLFDTKLEQSVWQGYNMMPCATDYNNRKLRRAVFSILDKYRIWAHGFIDQRTKQVAKTGKN